MNTELQNKIIEIATGELGKREKPEGSNWGEDIKKYLAAAKINFPAPWCMGFVQWVVQTAASTIKLPDPLLDSAGVLDTWNKIARKYRVVRGDGGDWVIFNEQTKQFDKTEPAPGDIFIMDFGKGKGHAGFVTKYKNAKRDKIPFSLIDTIEGNSNSSGSREGVEVCRKPNGRRTKTLKGFIRVTI